VKRNKRKETIEVDDEPIFPLYGKEKSIKNIDEEEDSPFATIEGGKENSHPNMIESNGGRLSL